jgi:enoyl-CoA hydratase
MDFETVLYEQAGPVGLLRLHRPERMNAVIEQMYLDIQSVLEKAEADPGLRVLILTGCVWKRPQGDKQAFCAGADLKKHASGERTPWQRRQYIQLAHETARRLYRFGRPVVAAVNGPARGAGAELVLGCDFIFMADTASLAFTETSLGTFVGGAATALLPRWVGLAQARRLIYTGAVLDGPQAVELGLALACCPVERLEDEAQAFARTLAERAPISLAFAKELINRAPQRDLETVLLAETEAILACMQTRDWQEGLDAFAEKRAPKFEGK